MKIKRCVNMPKDVLRQVESGAAFTLIEILVVVAIIGILLGMMGAVVRNSFRKAREAATIATIQKIDGLLQDRLAGFARWFETSPDIRRRVEAFEAQLANLTEDNLGNNDGTLQPFEDLNGNGMNDRGVLRLSRKVIEAYLRKRLFREQFPQRFEEMLPNSNVVPATTALPAVMASDPQITFDATKHRRRTESSALLYYSLTKMPVYGVPPVGESDFGTNEVRDTDGDGLLEFVDGWGRPLRFYRWPTRLLKPNGAYGIDGVPGNGGTTFASYGALGTDDVVIPTNIRELAGLLIDGLPSGPAVPGQWDILSEDPDDPAGEIMTELKRQFASGVHAYPTFPASSPSSPGRYQEPYYPTLDTYSTPLIVSVGADGVAEGDAPDSTDGLDETGLGLFEPYWGIDKNGDGIPDSELGILGQPRVTIDTSVSPAIYDVSTVNSATSALSDNITNRNRRAGGRR
jgi:prepilin-type N-terminal cleavage/methylation domain-containing protein